MTSKRVKSVKKVGQTFSPLNPFRKRNKSVRIRGRLWLTLEFGSQTQCNGLRGKFSKSKVVPGSRGRSGLVIKHVLPPIET